MTNLPSTTYQRRVPWGDVDAAGVWRFVAALSYVEEAETKLLRELDILHRIGVGLPRIYVEAQFSRAARFDDELEVRLSVVRVSERSVHYGFSILQNLQVAVTGKLGVAYLNEAGLPDVLPPDIRTALSESR